MDRRTHELTYEECEQWMRDLNVDWKRLLREADVGTHKDTIKNRWGDNKAPKDRAKIRATLEAMETKRKEPTPTGARILGLEEWAHIGEVLSREPRIFADELARLRQLAAPIRVKHEARAAMDRADAEIAEQMSTFGSVTPKPKR